MGGYLRWRVDIEVGGHAAAGAVAQLVRGRRPHLDTLVVDDRDAQSRRREDPREGGDARIPPGLDPRDDGLAEADDRGEVALAEVGAPSRPPDVSGGVDAGHEVAPRPVAGRSILDARVRHPGIVASASDITPFASSRPFRTTGSPDLLIS